MRFTPDLELDASAEASALHLGRLSAHGDPSAGGDLTAHVIASLVVVFLR